MTILNITNTADYNGEAHTTSGDDTVTINGDAFLFLSTGSGNDTVTHVGMGSVQAVLGAGDDIYHGSKGVDDVWGGSGNDWISAGGGDDIIHDGSGDDWVKGGGGNDTITVGSGHDILNYPFIFNNDSAGNLVSVQSACAKDMVFSFNPTEDKLQFSYMSHETFDQFVTVTNADVDGNGTIDTVIGLNTDSSFSITLDSVNQTANQIYDGLIFI